MPEPAALSITGDPVCTYPYMVAHSQAPWGDTPVDDGLKEFIPYQDLCQTDKPSVHVTLEESWCGTLHDAQWPRVLSPGFLTSTLPPNSGWEIRSPLLRTASEFDDGHENSEFLLRFLHVVFLTHFSYTLWSVCPFGSSAV